MQIVEGAALGRPSSGRSRLELGAAVPFGSEDAAAAGARRRGARGRGAGAIRAVGAIDLACATPGSRARSVVAANALCVERDLVDMNQESARVLVLAEADRERVEDRDLRALGVDVEVVDQG